MCVCVCVCVFEKMLYILTAIEVFKFIYEFVQNVNYIEQMTSYLCNFKCVHIACNIWRSVKIKI